MLRRTFLSILLLAGTLGSASGPQRGAGVDLIGLTVSDLDRSVEFYTGVLSFHALINGSASIAAVEVTAELAVCANASKIWKTPEADLKTERYPSCPYRDV